MDYDDNDFQSQNLHLAGEGGNKFPPALQPYALPKFDFDDSLHGHLRFDSLVETEVFLGIESNEDNQWIEDFSRGGSGIQFSSTAAESCSIPRRNNVWSEATSSESVEMLLKSVGQEEIIPVQANSRDSDACDELGCIIKQMEFNSKQDKTTLSRVEDAVQPMLPSCDIPEKISVLDDNIGQKQPQIKDVAPVHEADAPVDNSAGEQNVGAEVQLPLNEGSTLIDDKCDDANQRIATTMVNESFDNGAQGGSALVIQHDCDVDPMQNISAANLKASNENEMSLVDETAEDKIIMEANNGKNQEEKSVLSQEVQVDHQALHENVIETVASHLENSLHSASVELVEKANIIETNTKVDEPSCSISKVGSGSSKDLVIDDQLIVKSHESPKRFESSTSYERNEVEDSVGSQLDKNMVSGSSLLSAEYHKDAEGKVDEGVSSCVDNSSNLNVTCSSAELHGGAHESHVSSAIAAELIQTSEKGMVSAAGDIYKCDQDVAIEGGRSNGSHVDTGSKNEQVVSILQPESAIVNESVDGVSLSSGNCITTDVADHKDVDVSPLPVLGCGDTDKKGDISANISSEASLGKGDSSGAVGQMFESANESLGSVHARNMGPQGEPRAVELNKDTQEHEKERDAGTISEKEDDKQVSPVILDVSNDEMLGTMSSAKGEVSLDSTEKAEDKNEAPIDPRDKRSASIAVSLSNESERNAALENAASGSATVIVTELAQKESDKDSAKVLSGETVSVAAVKIGDAGNVSSIAQDPKQNDASKDTSFTFEVSPLVALPQKEAGKKRQPRSSTQANKVLPVVDGSPATPGIGQSVTKVSQDQSHGSPKVSDVATARTGSKGTTERKPRRPSAKAAGNASKRGTPIKEATPMRLGDKVANVSASPSGVSPLVQSNEVQRYGHVDAGGVKPFLLATSTSGLPDLNTSVSPSLVFQQPFTDLQQVQLRAQIFVYGALIQGTPPDEAYMISAFGGPDGGRNIWETAWRSCMERLHGQKSHIITPETPLQSRSGVRVPDQASKQNALQSKVTPSAQASNKGTPSTIASSMLPLSSPLWSMPTPIGDTLQSSGVPRGPVLDYQRALSPLHPHQTPSGRNFVGHNSSWISQAPFGPWGASPQSSALDSSGRFSVQLPITETVQLTPVKETVPHSSAAKHVPLSPVVQIGASAGIVTGSSPALDVRKIAASSGQPPTDPKPRKRKKNLAAESPAQNIMQSQSQAITIPAPAVSQLSTPVSIIAPSFSSIIPTEKLTISAPPPSSVDLTKGGQNVEQNNILSEETLGKLKEARVQAEEAAVLAAAAINHSQEIWNNLDKHRNTGLSLDLETKLASAAVAIAAAAAVAKAAAAAANVASNAALQAKLMADEAVVSGGFVNLSQSNASTFSEGMKNFGNATPASILKGDAGANGSSSVLVAAREAARRRVEAASAAAKRAENMDAIVKAAELAAEAVSQAGKIVAMGDPLPLNELVAAGPEGYWRLTQGNSELVPKSKDVNTGNVNIDSAGKSPDTSVRHLEGDSSEKRETHIANRGKSSTTKENSTEDQMRLDGLSGSVSATAKEAKGQKGRKASDLAKTVGMIPESESGPSSLVAGQNEYEKSPETSKENSIKEGSHVEVFKDGNGFKAAWFLADVLSLKDGKAYVSYNELSSGEGVEKLKEWVALKGEGNRAPGIRIATPITAMPFEGTRKRRRAAMGDYNLSVGDRVDAWIQDSWWEGLITEKSKKDETMLTVHFPARGETSVVRAWHLRPSLIWKDGEWVEWSNSRETDRASHGGDTPQEKRPRVQSPAVEAKGKDKTSTSVDATETEKSNEPTLLELTADDKLFNIGKSTRDGNKPDSLRMTRTGLQKEGSKVIFGVPKPGKKRKFMEVSKHYVAERRSKMSGTSDSVKFTKYLMPQGTGNRGWKNTTKTEPTEKRPAMLKPRATKSGKVQNVSGRTIPQKDNSISSTVYTPDDDSAADHFAKTKDSGSHSEHASGKQNTLDFQSSSSAEGPTDGSSSFGSLAPPADTLSSKKSSTSNIKPERISKGKLAPASGKLGKIEEDKVFSFNSVKSASDAIEPRRSNRRIQPTSRLLEGLQSSLMVSKIPSISHDKSHKNRTASKRE